MIKPLNKKLVLFVSFVFILLALSGCDNSNEANKKAFATYEIEKKHQEDFIEQNRVDSLQFYTYYADSLFENKKLKEGVNILDSALNYAKYSDKIDILKLRVIHLVTLKRYEAAIEDYSTLIEREKENADYYLQRATCYKSQDEIQLAVDDLKESIELGSEEAIKLHDKINPIRKKITGYVTRCCDGSTSHATGRGACSHHGGVCNWNDPVYQEYRKY